LRHLVKLETLHCADNNNVNNNKNIYNKNI
jgi:hypothetical protein